MKKIIEKQGLLHIGTIHPPIKFEKENFDLLKKRGYGDMDWLFNNLDLRLNPSNLFPNLESIILLAMPCNNKQLEINGIKQASFSIGKDYHKIFRNKMKAIIKSLPNKYNYRACVDSAPVFEKKLAQLGGFGFIGKNSLFIHKKLGSFFLLGNILTDMKAEKAFFKTKNKCDECLSCIKNCPQNALKDGFYTENCISYLTIEHKGVIPKQNAKNMNGWWFGCDCCQTNCPHNKEPHKLNIDNRLNSNEQKINLDEITEENFNKIFEGRGIRRLGYDLFRRNLLVAYYSIGNTNKAKEIFEKSKNIEIINQQAKEIGIK